MALPLRSAPPHTPSLGEERGRQQAHEWRASTSNSKPLAPGGPAVRGRRPARGAGAGAPHQVQELARGAEVVVGPDPGVVQLGALRLGGVALLRGGRLARARGDEARLPVRAASAFLPDQRGRPNPSRAVGLGAGRGGGWEGGGQRWPGGPEWGGCLAGRLKRCSQSSNGQKDRWSMRSGQMRRTGRPKR